MQQPDNDKAQRYRAGRLATWVGIIGNVLLTLFKGVVGIVSGSIALIADAFHSLSDVMSSLVVLGGLKYSQLPADANHHYGHAKAESIAAKIVAIMLMAAAAGIAWTAYQVILKGQINIPTTAALWAAAVSIVVKEGMYHYTIRVGRRINSVAVKADAWHHRTDALSSIAALAGIGGALLGYPFLDPVAGIIVALMIAWAAVGIYWSAIKDLMDQAPKQEMMIDIEKTTAAIPGIMEVQEVKGRLHGPVVYIDMKISVPRDITVEQGHQLANQAKQIIIAQHPEVEEVLIHVNPYNSLHKVH